MGTGQPIYSNNYLSSFVSVQKVATQTQERSERLNLRSTKSMHPSLRQRMYLVVELCALIKSVLPLTSITSQSTPHLLLQFESASCFAPEESKIGISTGSPTTIG